MDISEVFYTVRDYLRYTVSQFNKAKLTYGHGTTNAYDEAVSLILQALDLPIDQLEPYLDAKLLAAEKEVLVQIISRRINERIPLAYITNKAFLQGYEFYVDKRVIIPRSFLAEIIVNNQLEELIPYPELVYNTLDLCTGNGSLACILADYYYEAKVVASDISDSALEVAQINIANYGLEEVVSIVKSDLFNNLEDYLNSFDLIVTNPPYVDNFRMGSLTSEYKHEPEIALFGGHDGLDLVNRILVQAKHYLTETGVLIVEMGDNQAELIMRYPDLNFKWLNSRDGIIFALTYADLADYFD